MTTPATGSLRGVRLRMVLLVLLPIVPLVGLVAWQSTQVRDRAEGEAGTDALRLSRLTAGSVTARVLQTAAVVRLAARVSTDLLVDGSRCAEALAEGAPADGSVLNAFVADPTGKVICSLATLPARLDPAARPYLRAALETGDTTAGVEMPGDLVPTPALVVAQRLGDDRLLAVAIDLAADLGSIVDTFALPEGSTVTLLDDRGLVIGNWPPAAVGRPSRLAQVAEATAGGSVEGTIIERGPDGRTRVYSYVDIAETGSSVFAVVGIPTSWAFAPANRELRTNLLALAIIAVGTIGIAVFLAERWINRHLRAITSTARRIGAGDLSARVGPRRAAGELAELAGTVDRMAGDIQGRDAALRTATSERARLVDELLDVQEQERRRIAADIHDDTIQTVVACGMSAQLLQGRLTDPIALDQAAQLADRLARATARLRQLTFDLDPAANGLDLAEGLDRYLVGALEDRQVAVMVSADVPFELQGPVRQVVYRNVREATLNSVTHGAARRVTVMVEVEGGGIRVDVTDDGVGFVPDPRGWPGHQGVRTMRQRAEALGGTFELTSVVGTGTRLTFWIPVDRATHSRPTGGPPSGEELSV